MRVNSVTTPYLTLSCTILFPPYLLVLFIPSTSGITMRIIGRGLSKLALCFLACCAVFALLSVDNNEACAAATFIDDIGDTSNNRFSFKDTSNNRFSLCIVDNSYFCLDIIEDFIVFCDFTLVLELVLMM